MKSYLLKITALYFVITGCSIFYDTSEETQKALADSNQVIKIDPSDIDAYNNRGLLYYQSGEINKALADYNQAIKIDPSDIDAYYNRGLLYHEQLKEINKALADSNQVITLNLTRHSLNLSY